MIITSALYLIVFLGLFFTVGHRKGYIISAALPVATFLVLGILSAGMSISALFVGIWIVVREKNTDTPIGAVIAAIVFSCLPLFYFAILIARVRN